ncbi:major facilitator superfamily domain-containing protein 12-like [Coccinella septempunctata]|uniref:major facilitator superfamily domain-containing protein 12-like n=1 Tax=Coccinella septempunctata TaxID=41139 RepID=UPI001D093C23|nr:major facilitator superfamily domain-containing protein 12-like [Coccinella septempunctata]XP_044764975.1 major facilitator superfamily domain-containing protein 12-like [Coccinella septempunctata]XP_044764976.1 major facilitator superfamily domain-containing protein 12-like [Coccinella septempunctata]
MESSQHLISNDYTEVYQSLPRALQLAYGMGHVLNDVCASMWFTYLLVYFHLVLQFSNWEAGFLLLVGQVADGLATPLVGFQSDHTDGGFCYSYGKRKSWHLFGTICVLCAFPFIFSPCIHCVNMQRWIQMLYYSIFIVIFQFGWAAVQISHLSLIPELTPNEHDRTRLTAVRYGFTVISSIFVYINTWFILHLNNSKLGPSDSPKFQKIVWIGIIFGSICSILFHIFVREGERYGGRDIRGGQPRHNVSDLLTNIKIYKVAVIYMSTRLFVNLSQVFIPLYLHESLDMTASNLALIPLTIFIGSFIMSIGIEKLNRIFGRKLAYIVGVVMGVAACLWIQFDAGPFYFYYGIYGVAVLIGAGGSVVLVTSLGITADLIGDKTSSGAFVYGIMSFTDKLANGIAVIIIQDLHSDGSNKNYYRDILTYVCGASMVLGSFGVISLIKYRPREGLARNIQVPNYNSINSEVTTSENSSLLTI